MWGDSRTPGRGGGGFITVAIGAVAGAIEGYEEGGWQGAVAGGAVGFFAPFGSAAAGVVTDNALLGAGLGAFGWRGGDSGRRNRRAWRGSFGYDGESHIHWFVRAERNHRCGA